MCAGQRFAEKGWVGMGEERFDAVRARYYQAAFVRDLGMELVSVEEGVALSRLSIADRHLQQDGFVHAGVVSTLADHTGGAAAWSLVEPHQTVLTVEFKIQFLHPARGPLLTARAEVMRPGRRIVAAECDVFNPDGGRAAKLTMTLSIVEIARLSREE
jgi:uncharacterized protein (TIGR00369 family)